MDEAPERIWAKVHGASTDVISGKRGMIGGWNEHKRDGQVEYVRADRIEPLKREVKELLENYTRAVNEASQQKTERSHAERKVAELDPALTQVQADYAKLVTQTIEQQAELARLSEALRKAADRFDEIRVILIEHLDEPERNAFWKAVNGREFCRHSLAAQEQGR